MAIAQSGFIERKPKTLKLNTFPKLAVRAVGRLMDYSLAGNVRELENVIERALILHGRQKNKFVS